MINLDDRIFKDGIVAKIKGNAFSVFMAIATHMDKKNTCYPSISRLEFLTGLKQDTVISCTKKLCEAGLLKKSQAKKGGKYASNVYEVSKKYVKFYVPEKAAKKKSPSRKKTDTEKNGVGKKRPKVLGIPLSINKALNNISEPQKNDNDFSFEILKTNTVDTLKNYGQNYYAQEILKGYCEHKKIKCKILKDGDIQKWATWVDIEKLTDRILAKDESYFKNGKSNAINNSISHYLTSTNIDDEAVNEIVMYYEKSFRRSKDSEDIKVWLRHSTVQDIKKLIDIVSSNKSMNAATIFSSNYNQDLRKYILEYVKSLELSKVMGDNNNSFSDSDLVMYTVRKLTKIHPLEEVSNLINLILSNEDLQNDLKNKNRIYLVEEFNKILGDYSDRKIAA